MVLPRPPPESRRGSPDTMALPASALIPPANAPPLATPGPSELPENFVRQLSRLSPSPLGPRLPAPHSPSLPVPLLSSLLVYTHRSPQWGGSGGTGRSEGARRVQPQSAGRADRSLPGAPAPEPLGLGTPAAQTSRGPPGACVEWATSIVTVSETKMEEILKRLLIHRSRTGGLCVSPREPLQRTDWHRRTVGQISLRSGLTDGSWRPAWGLP